MGVPGETGQDKVGARLRRNEGGQKRSTCLSGLQRLQSFFACLKPCGRFPHSQTQGSSDDPEMTGMLCEGRSRPKEGP